MNRIAFETLFAALPSPHNILDHDLNFVAVNPAYEAVTMRSADQLIGRNMFECFPNEGDGGRRLRESLLGVLSSGEPDTIAYIEYEIARRDGSMERRFWTAVHNPLRDAEGRVLFVLQNTVDITELVLLREAASVPFTDVPSEVALVQRALEAEAASETNRSESENFRRLFQGAPGLMAVLQGADHVFTFANDDFARFVGDRPVLGLPVRTALPGAADAGLFESLERVRSSGRPERHEALPIAMTRAGGEVPATVYVDVTFSPIRDGRGEVSGILVQGSDRTEAVMAQRRERLWADELNHRVKNTLATVQSLARQSFTEAGAPPQVKSTFEGRIIALSKAHDLLSESHWAAVDLAALLRPAEATIAANGNPPVQLNPKAAIALAMLFHELRATIPADMDGQLLGDVEINWSRHNGARLKIIWVARNLPPVWQSERKLQTRMLKRLVEGELDGRMDCDEGGDGFTCEICIPMREVEEDAAAGGGH
ncbi:sensor histidine kinase [Mangrovibrevibacter kandeliae]|uniref:sensor histidine kinase n=1 Tax=Mangrovibrevibacter kandeliae TaxID=2968473 RepID=UPI002117F441|nr:HWE histidine kinase domain-containing protein [Aurantimonas sp. CSK15Z-1]MCQ8783935.1 PAS domain-containing protein [Aurantimonas sp. CSK15Z-1]